MIHKLISFSFSLLTSPLASLNPILSSNIKPSSYTIQHLNSKLLSLLKTQSNEGIRITISQLFKISHKITNLQNQLSNQTITQSLEYLQSKKYNVYFEGLRMFVSKSMRYYNNYFLVELVFKGEEFEVRNSAFERRSLYFGDIKDFDEHIEIVRYNENVEEHIKEKQRKIIENSLIDRDNPLGFPQVKSSFIELKITKLKRQEGLRQVKQILEDLPRLQTEQMQGRLEYKLGKIRLISLAKTFPHSISKRKSIRKLQNLNRLNTNILKVLKDFTEDLIPVEDFQQMNILSKVSNQFSQIEQLKKLYKIIAFQLLDIEEKQL